MKDSLFEMLLNLFEKTLAQLKEQHASENTIGVDLEKSVDLFSSSMATSTTEPQVEVIKTSQSQSIRVFTADERVKFTKASYQFLMRMMSWGILVPHLLESVLNRMIFSESRFVTLQETKWIIRHTLADTLNAKQLAFLDLVLYQREDGLSLH